MLAEVVLIGAGGFGREALDVIEAHNSVRPAAQIHVVGVVDDAPSDINLERVQSRGYRLLGSIGDALSEQPSGSGYVLGIGSPHARRAIARRFDSAGWRAITVVHPAAVVSPTARIGEGAIICGGVQLSTNTRLGRHVHLNPNATIGHDATLYDFVSVNPGAVVSGEVAIHEAALIGAGAVVLQGLRVSAEARVGASACVTYDVGPGSTVIGVPARPRVAERGTPR